MNKDRIERGKWLLNNVRHAAMATVNVDNSPHNTPYLFMKSNDLTELYWGSNPKSVHSQNIERSGNIFVVLYEANEGGGLYIRCNNGRIAENEELERALEAHNNLRQKLGKDNLPVNYYTGESEQRMYIADTVTFWINYAERDETGRIKEDKRIEVSRSELLAD